jgi:hypothetical protein
VTKRKRAATRQRTDGEILLAAQARHTERLFRSLIRDQNERVMATANSFDAVRLAHDEKHRHIDKRLTDLEQANGVVKELVDSMRRALEEMRDIVDPLKSLLDQLRAARLRAAVSPPEEDPTARTAAGT